MGEGARRTRRDGMVGAVIRIDADTEARHAFLRATCWRVCTAFGDWGAALAYEAYDGRVRRFRALALSTVISDAYEARAGEVGRA